MVAKVENGYTEREWREEAGRASFRCGLHCSQTTQCLSYGPVDSALRVNVFLQFPIGRLCPESVLNFSLLLQTSSLGVRGNNNQTLRTQKDLNPKEMSIDLGPKDNDAQREGGCLARSLARTGDENDLPVPGLSPQCWDSLPSDSLSLLSWALLGFP